MVTHEYTKYHHEREIWPRWALWNLLEMICLLCYHQRKNWESYNWKNWQSWPPRGSPLKEPLCKLTTGTCLLVLINFHGSTVNAIISTSLRRGGKGSWGINLQGFQNGGGESNWSAEVIMGGGGFLMGVSPHYIIFSVTQLWWILCIVCSFIFSVEKLEILKNGIWQSLSNTSLFYFANE